MKFVLSQCATLCINANQVSHFRLEEDLGMDGAYNISATLTNGFEARIARYSSEKRAKEALEKLNEWLSFVETGASLILKSMELPLTSEHLNEVAQTAEDILEFQMPPNEEEADDKEKHKAAVKTLESMGYTYHGGELWKPPVGETPWHIQNGIPPETAKFAEGLAQDIAVRMNNARCRPSNVLPNVNITLQPVVEKFSMLLDISVVLP